MLNPITAERFGRNLATIDRLAPMLTNAADKTRTVTTPDPSGITAGKPGPKPPTGLGAIDLELDARDTLASWLTNLADDHGFPPSWFTGSVLNLRELAFRMGRVVSHVAHAEWGHDCAEEIDTLTRRLTDALERDTPTTEADPARRELNPTAANRHVTATDAATILTHIGHTITADQIRKWRSRGHITEVGRNNHGRHLYRLGDIADRLTGANA